MTTGRVPAWQPICQSPRSRAAVCGPLCRAQARLQQGRGANCRHQRTPGGSYRRPPCAACLTNPRPKVSQKSRPGAYRNDSNAWQRSRRQDSSCLLLRVHAPEYTFPPANIASAPCAPPAARKSCESFARITPRLAEKVHRAGNRAAGPGCYGLS